MIRLRSLALAALLAAVPAAAQTAPAADKSAYELREVTVQPRPVNVPTLVAALESLYPPLLRDGGIGGTVVVRMLVGEDGVPRDIRAVRSTDTAFVAATVEAVSRLRFSPAQLGGKPVKVWVELPIQWTAEPRPTPAADGAYDSGVLDAPLSPRNYDAFRRQLDTFYPTLLRDAGVTGEVKVTFVVGVDGVPRDVRIISLSQELFETPVREALAVLRYSPGMLRGRPVPVRVTRTIRFDPMRGMSRW